MSYTQSMVMTAEMNRLDYGLIKVFPSPGHYLLAYITANFCSSQSNSDTLHRFTRGQNEGKGNRTETLPYRRTGRQANIVQIPAH